MTQQYTVILARSARRQLTQGLPEAVATAAWEFIYGPLSENPYRVGKRLNPPMEDLFVARRGPYRIIYEVHTGSSTRSKMFLRVIEVVQIEHRRDAYRT